MKPFAITLKALFLSLLISASAWAADKVNLNTASAAAIDAAMVNVGPAKAEAIVEYRDINGPFKSIEELAMVKGIGLKTIEKNRDRIEIGKPATVANPAARGVNANTTPAKPVVRR